MDDKKAKLAELIANKKRKEMEEAARQIQKRQEAHKAALIDFGDSDDEEDAPPASDKPAARPAAPAVADDDDEGPLMPNAQDDDFIDDEGVAPDQRIDFGDDDAPGTMFEEAEEAEEEDAEDELDRLFNKRQRRDGGNDADNRAVVDNLLVQMELAVEEDLRAVEANKPALNKLRMLPRVEEVLAMAKLYGELLDAGLLGVLKAWIEPMPDGTLPNSKIRSSVLNMLTRLPVDCSYEDRKEQLKRSGMGRIVMFLSKLPDELPANRRIAQQLVEKWSRPILAPRRDRAREEEEEQRILKARQRREQAKRAAAPAVEEDPDNPAAGPRPGQPGFRYRAAVPEGASLDYVNRPASKVASLSDGRGGG